MCLNRSFESGSPPQPWTMAFPATNPLARGVTGAAMAPEPTIAAVTPVATRERLLEAAGEVFASRGFHDATVREICARAEANIASVNYHFGDKAQLYSAVFQFCKSLTKSDDVQMSHMTSLPAVDRVRGFVAWYMTMLFDTSRPAWAWQLFAREMVDPTPALDHMVETVIRPRMHFLQDAIREIVGPNVPDERVNNCIGSIMGQCLLYKHSLPVVTRLYPEMKFDSAQAVHLASHIADFSLAGLEAIRDQFNAKPRSWRERLCPKERAKRNDSSRKGGKS